MLNHDPSEHHHRPGDESPTLYFSPVSQLTEVRAFAADPELLRRISASDRRGQVALGSGDLAGAEACFAESLELRQRGGSAAQAGMPQAFGRLAVVALRRGQTQRARDLFELGLEIARALRTQLSADDAMLLQNLGYIARMAGDLDEAERCYASALSIKLLAVGERHSTVATTLCSQGMVLLRRGCPEAALAKFERAREIHEAATGTLSAGLGHVHMGTGSALLKLGRRRRSAASGRRYRCTRRCRCRGRRSPAVGSSWRARAGLAIRPARASWPRRRCASTPRTRATIRLRSR